MEFWEKMGEVAKNVKVKASDSLEINRINGDVFTMKHNIEIFQQKLGEFYWAKFVMGEELEEEAVEICEKIVVCKDNIRKLNEEINDIKEKQTEEKARQAEEKIKQTEEKARQSEENENKQQE